MYNNLGGQPKKHYTYRLTCTHPESPHRYYYGSRTCLGDPNLDHYWSSSPLVADARRSYGPEYWTKRVISDYPTHTGALALEVRVHAYFDVRNHPLFFNRANQTSTKFMTLPGPLPAETQEKIAEADRRR